ncbi:MAG: hypothetical protein IH585_03925 [Anaerolineaceae bacterium]|nr:hypothetical protein [Anaerolineaceae bacterium]
MQTPLLQTKLYIPPTRNQLVNRSRLIRQLYEGVGYKLTIISAPAGFGKTTLVQSWIDSLEAKSGQQNQQGQNQSKVGWVSLDERDNDPTLFWHYVIAASQTIIPGFGKHVQTLLESSPTFSHEVLVTMLINEFVEHQQTGRDPVQFLLILDDYHLISNQVIHDSINFLLDHLPHFLHLVITTRADPPLKLSYRYGRSEIYQIRAADLSFNSDESAEFLNALMGLGLSQKDINSLENRTEGWIAGLKLAALSLQEQAEKHKFVSDFAGDDRYIADYLIDEVLYNQPPHIQDFLLKTSVLNQLCGSLCKALTGQNESQSILNQLEHDNLFLNPLDNRREWYRYHSLFTDLLRQRLRESVEEPEIAKLHQLASKWYEGKNEIIESLDHAILSRDYPRAAQLIEQRSEEIFQQFKLNTLVNWVQTFPPSIVGARPVLSMIYAWALLATGKSSELESCLQAIEGYIGLNTGEVSIVGLKTIDPTTRGALIEVLVVRSVIAINQFDISKTLELCQLIEPYLRDNSQPHLFNPALSLRTVVVFNLGLAHEFSGDANAAAAAFDEAVSLSLAQKNANILTISIAHLGQLQMLQGHLRLANKTYYQALKLGAEITGQQSPLAGIVEVGLGNLAYEWNDLEQSLDHIKAGMDLGRHWNHSEILMYGYLGLARIEQAQGNSAEALAVLQELETILHKNSAQIFLPAVHAFRARLWVYAGKLAQAAQWVQAENLQIGGDLSYLKENDYITFARLLIAENKWVEAEKLIGRLLEFAGSEKRDARVVELMMLHAIAKYGQGESDHAESILSRTLKMAEPEGYIRLFVDEGSAIAPLLYQILVHEKNFMYAERLLQAFRPQEMEGQGKENLETFSENKLLEPLSEREIEVLQCLAQGLSNREIALKLTISLTTVKTHTRNIYGKLGVNSRTQAIIQAKSWGIIS